MSQGGQNKFVPNDHIFQVDYKPFSELLDYRGRWASLLADKADLPSWKVEDNQVDLTGDTRGQGLSVGFKRLYCGTVDASHRDGASQQIQKYLQATFSLPNFPQTLTVRRVAVRSRFCTAYRGSFDELLSRFRSNFGDLTSDAYSAVGSDANLIDLGYPFYFTTPLGTIWSRCGPMTGEQLSEFFSYRQEDTLPEVGIYYDSDLWSRPESDIEMGEEELTASLTEFSRDNWDRYQRLRKVVLRGK